MKKLKILFVIWALIFSGCSSSTVKESFLSDWDNVREVLVEEAKEINKCDWKLTKKDIKSVEKIKGKELDVFLSSRNIDKTKDVNVFFVTFNSYCGRVEKNSLVSAYLIEDSGKYKVIDLSLVED